uniref:Uncharacterized protein n=2 Tax=Rhizophora mucronata TaxID=61149 RepID=A0A2P2K8X0_RHIMU
MFSSALGLVFTRIFRSMLFSLVKVEIFSSSLEFLSSNSLALNSRSLR